MILTDPRSEIIGKRLEEVDRVIAVVSGKGGVGKSTVASLLSLILSEKGHRVGLLDIDLQGPSCPLILGAEGLEPVEDKGIVPPLVRGVKLMSIAYYLGESPLPLRGPDISNAIVELLAVAKWGKLDYLLLDMPPGMSEEVLDLMRLIPRGEAFVVAAPSVLALNTVVRLIKLLKELEVPIIGMVENMRAKRGTLVEDRARKLGVKYLGSLPFNLKLEEALGKPKALLRTELAKSLEKVAMEIQI